MRRLWILESDIGSYMLSGDCQSGVSKQTKFPFRLFLRQFMCLATWLSFGLAVTSASLAAQENQAVQDPAETTKTVAETESVWKKLGLAEPNPDAPYANPPKLEMLFEDDFSTDTRGKYKISGPDDSVTWEPGKLTLNEGAVLARDVNANDWIEIEFDLQFAALTADGQKSEFKIELNLEPATDSYVVLYRERTGDAVRSRIAIYDLPETEEAAGVIVPELVRQVEFDQDLPSGRWQITYRNGLWRVVSMGHSLRLLGHIQNGVVEVGEIRVFASSNQYGVSGLIVQGAPTVAISWTAQQHQALIELYRLIRQIGPLFQQGRASDAVPIAERVLRELPVYLGQFHPDFATSLDIIAGWFTNVGDYPRAEPLFREAITIGEKVLGKEHPEYATSLNNLAELYRTMGDFPRAEPLNRQALGIYEQVLGKEHAAYANSLNNLATLNSAMGNYAFAEPLFREAIVIREEVRGKEHPDYATSLNSLAQLYSAIGDYARAEPLNRQALWIYEQSLGKEHLAYAHSLNSLAVLYNEMGDYPRAEPLYREALGIRERVGGKEHPAYANSLNNLALLYKNMSDFGRAETLYREALTIREKVLGKEHPNYATSLNNLASLYSAMNDYARAEMLYREAITIGEKVLGKEHPNYATSLNNLAQLYHFMDDYARAEPRFLEAMTIRKRVLATKHPDYATSLNNLATLYHDMGDYMRAKPLYQDAVDISLLHLEKTSAIQSESQQLQMAMSVEFYFTNYLTSIAESKGAAVDVMVRALQWKGAIFARQRLMRLARETDDPKILSLLDELNSTSSRLATLTMAVLNNSQQRETWRRQVDELSENRERIERDLNAQSEAFRAIKSAAKIHVDQLRGALPADTALVDLHEYSRKSERTNEYGVPQYDAAYCALVLRDGHPVELVELGYKEEVDQLIGEWRQQFATASAVGSNPAPELRRLLWEPLSEKLEGINTVLISPEGAIGTLPLYALPGKKLGTYLIEEVAIVTTTFPQLLPELMRENDQELTYQMELLLVGDVDFDNRSSSSSVIVSNKGNTDNQNSSSEQEDSQTLVAMTVTAPRARSAVRGDGLARYDHLPGTKVEIEQIAKSYQRLFSSNAIQTLVGMEATKQQFHLLAPQCRYLHIATHGFFAPEKIKSAKTVTVSDNSRIIGDSMGQAPVVGVNPGLLSGLAFAGANQSVDPLAGDNSILSAMEVGEMNLSSVELAVLSACETGLGQVAGGEGVLGLQRAFQLAGARTTVTSLWRVDDHATQVLMSRFYHNLWEKKLGKVEALREAQLWMLRQPDEVKAEIGKLRGGEDELADTTDQSYASPKYWAAWVLSGDWR